MARKCVSVQLSYMRKFAYLHSLTRNRQKKATVVAVDIVSIMWTSTPK